MSAKKEDVKDKKEDAKEEKKEKQEEVKEEVKEEKKEEKKVEKKEEKKEEKKAEKPEKAQEETSAKEDKIDVPKKLQKIIDSISELTVLEASTLVKAMEEAFGVSAQAAVAMPMGMVAGGEGGGAEEEEKTTFDVELKDFGSAKIKVIKVVREATSLSLKEAKTLVEAAPTKIKEGMSRDDAEDLKTQIEEVGGTVEIK